MKSLLTFLLCFPIFLFAQTTADFEDIVLEPETYLNGSEGADEYETGHISLFNEYNFSWQSWIGWSVSNITDNTTPGFQNQYSSIVGAGVNNSANYGVCYAFDPVTIRLTDEGRGLLEGFYISNSTYGYYSMLEGDGFAKKFGGVTGDDEDYLLLTVKRWWNGDIVGDSIDVYLADYRFSDNNEDYIWDDWHYIDLSSFEGNVDSVQLSLSSSDTGMFGMNTPAYICMDNFVTLDMLITATESLADEVELNLYPNPSADFLHVHSGEFMHKIEVYDLSARLVLTDYCESDQARVDLEDLISSKYFVKIYSDKGVTLASFIKQ